MMKNSALKQIFDAPQLAGKPKYLKPLLVLAMLLAMLAAESAWAKSRQQHGHRPAQVRTVSMQEVYLTVSQYELALIQVLSEICPSMLTQTQRVRFSKAYNEQLRSFMPNSANPQQTLKYLSGQREYRLVLHNVRSWTSSYPAAENRALCQEFAQSVF